MFPWSEKAIPCLQSLVAATQSNISTPCSIANLKSSGVPTHIRYLGLSFGSRGVVWATTCSMSSLLSQTLTPQMAIPSRANWLRYCADSVLKSR